jgi:hypothetical protein
MFNEKRELAADTIGPRVVTYTANPQTAALPQTIADGEAMTDAEVGQAFADLTALVNALIAKVNS